jgi:hypothetical protein
MLKGAFRSNDGSRLHDIAHQQVFGKIWTANKIKTLRPMEVMAPDAAAASLVSVKVEMELSTSPLP